MAGRLINGVKYVGLYDDNKLKSKSLEDTIYFTLRDIFWNGEPRDCVISNMFNKSLSNGIRFEDRDENFEYADVLYDYTSDYTKKLYNWLLTKDKNSLFEFVELKKDEEIDMAEYMNYDVWFVQFKELIKKIEEQLAKHKKWEAEDVLSELSGDLY